MVSLVQYDMFEYQVKLSTWSQSILLRRKKLRGNQEILSTLTADHKFH